MKLNDAMPILNELGNRLGFRPDVPLGMEEFLNDCVRQLEVEQPDLDAILLKKLESAFPSMGERPQWLQDPEWQMRDGRPMMFVGQIDRITNDMKVSFYVFKALDSGITKVAIQVVGRVAA